MPLNRLSQKSKKHGNKIDKSSLWGYDNDLFATIHYKITTKANLNKKSNNQLLVSCGKSTPHLNIHGHNEVITSCEIKYLKLYKACHLSVTNRSSLMSTEDHISVQGGGQPTASTLRNTVTCHLSPPISHEYSEYVNWGLDNGKFSLTFRDQTATNGNKLKVWDKEKSTAANESPCSATGTTNISLHFNEPQTMSCYRVSTTLGMLIRKNVIVLTQVSGEENFYLSAPCSVSFMRCVFLLQWN
jgi:hypothetical protein